MKVMNLRNSPELMDEAIHYFQMVWATDASMKVYEDCIKHSITTTSPIPHWYILMDGDEIIGCIGLITNDFVSRMDLWPYICALYIDEKHRGKALSKLLIDACKEDAKKAGFEKIYLCTDHIGLYEKFGFKHIGTGYHPWGDSSRIYESTL